MCNLGCTDVQCDEIWGFVGSKAKNVLEGRKGELGDVWCWVAIDAKAKLVPSWLIGGTQDRRLVAFLDDLRERLGYGMQLSCNHARAAYGRSRLRR